MYSAFQLVKIVDKSLSLFFWTQTVGLKKVALSFPYTRCLQQKYGLSLHLQEICTSLPTYRTLQKFSEERLRIAHLSGEAKFADIDYTEGQNAIYQGNNAQQLPQNEGFLGNEGTKTVQSKNWDNVDDTSSDIKRNDIDDPF